MSRLLFPLGLLCVPPALAQPAAPPPARLAPPQSLAEALKNTYWNSEQRGPLIAIAPERVGLPYLPGGRPQLPPLPPSNGYNAQEISTYFDYQPFRLGGLTVLAPRTIRHFTRPSLTPEQAAPLSRTEATYDLLASLSKTQWERLGSPQGLGLSDLDRRQEPLFLAMLPPKMTLQARYVPGRTSAASNEPRTLSESERLSTRLRITTQIQMHYLMEGRNNHYISFGDEQNRGAEYGLAFPGPPEDNDPLLIRLFPKVPNKLKTGELDFAHPRLDVTVSLEGVATLGELLERVGQATRLTLKADYRVANLPLALRGQRARASEVLQALALGVCGAFRKIDGSTFLLTEAAEGLTVRLAAYELWAEKVWQLQEKRQEERRKKLGKSGAALTLENPDGLSPELLQKLDRSRLGTDKPGEEPGFAVSELPSALKARVQEATKRTVMIGEEAGGAPRPAVIRSDRVALSKQLQLAWVVPGIGAISDSSHSLWNLETLLAQAPAIPEAQSLPPTGPLFAPAWKERIAIIALTDPAEAREAVRLTKQAGFTTLWVEVPWEVSRVRPLLEAALVQARTEGIAVGAQLSLPPDSPDTDRSPLGTPLRLNAERLCLATTPEAIQHLVERVTLLGKLPGLTALSLNISLRGYHDNEYVSTQQAPGYLPGHRQAFFQKTGNDILDLPTNPYQSYPVALGHFTRTQAEHVRLADNSYGPDPSFKDLGRTWREFVNARRDSVYQQLDPMLKTQRFPVYLPLGQTWLLGQWKLPKPGRSFNVVFTGEGSYEEALFNQARRDSPVVFQTQTLWKEATPEQLRASLCSATASALKQKQPADGIAVSLTSHPFSEIKNFLAALASVSPPSAR